MTSGYQNSATEVSRKLNEERQKEILRQVEEDKVAAGKKHPSDESYDPLVETMDLDDEEGMSAKSTRKNVNIEQNEE